MRCFNLANKHLLVTISDYQLDHNGAESLDAVLAMAVFDLDVDIFFTGHGVKQVLKDQDALPNGKLLSKQWASASIYGIENLWVCSDSYADNSCSELIMGTEIIEAAPNPNDYKFHLSF